MTTPLQKTKRSRGRTPVMVWISIAILAVLVIVAIVGPLITPLDQTAQDTRRASQGPSGEFWLGTDALGRDVLSRLMVGTGSAVLAPLVIALGSFLIGNVLGLIAGYRGGWADSAVMRWVDMMWSIPNLLVLIVVSGTIGAGYWTSVFLLLLLSIPFDARVVRGATLEQRPRPYVEAAKTLGLSDRHIMIRHIWPNVAPVAVANAFLVFAGSLVSLAALSFLGLGVPPGTPDWGLMISENQSLMFSNPSATLIPACLVAILALAMTVVGDWIDGTLRAKGEGR